MRLVCRECSAAYEAPDNLFGQQPREVRCNRCGYQWTVVGQAKAGETPLAPRGEQPVAQLVPPAPASRAAESSPPAPAARDPDTATITGDTTRLTDARAAQAPSAPLRAESTAVSTRTLLGDRPAIDGPIDLPDAEERRLSHELSFGETERQQIHHRGRSFRGIWLLILIVIVAIIAAILFKPQLVGAFPSLAQVYASVGL